MKKIVVALLLSSLVLYGCGILEEDTVRYTCNYDLSGIIDVESEIEASGNEVTLIKNHNSAYYVDNGIDLDVLLSISEELKELADGDDGIKYEYEYDDSTYHEYITMDMKKMDLQYAVDNGFITVDGEDVTYIGLEETITAVEEMNGTCVEE